MARVVDIHCHAAPAPGIAELVRGVQRPEDDASSFFSSAESLAHNRKLAREEYGLALTSVEERLARMDRMRVDVQAISPSPQQFYWAEPALGARLSRLQNEHVARTRVAVGAVRGAWIGAAAGASGSGEGARVRDDAARIAGRADLDVRGGH